MDVSIRSILAEDTLSLVKIEFHTLGMTKKNTKISKENNKNITRTANSFEFL